MSSNVYEVISIDDLREQYKEKIKAKDIKEFAAVQQKLIEDLLLRNKALEDKLQSAESILKGLQKPSGLVNIMSEEELICVEQIQILKGKSAQRELSLDEVKRLDILIKNLRLIRDKSTEAIDVTDYSDMKEADLVALITGTGKGSEEG